MTQTETSLTERMEGEGMKSITKAGSRWRTLMVLTPLVLLVILAIAAGGSISAGSAVYAGYSSSHGA